MCHEISAKLANIKFNENPFSDFHGVRCGQTDMKRLSGAFLQSAANAPKKGIKTAHMRLLRILGANVANRQNAF
jgi:hypothetical protein